MAYADAAGFFGKLPCAGDFVQRRLPTAFVEAWDGHFEQVVAGLRDALGAAWPELYRAAPSWRFLLPAGLCGDDAWAGLMTPSADRVGRSFPLVVATRIAAAPGIGAWRENDGWFARAERIGALARSGGASSVEAFDEHVRVLPDLADETAIPGREPPFEVDWDAGAYWRFPLPRHLDAAPSLLGWWARLAVLEAPWCLWWSDGGARVPASVLITRGLPPSQAYAGFIDATHAGGAWRAPDAFAPTVLESSGASS